VDGERFARAHDGDMGAETQRGPGAEPLQFFGQRSGAKPPPHEAERHSLFRRPKDGEIWPIIQDFSPGTRDWGISNQRILVCIVVDCELLLVCYDYGYSYVWQDRFRRE